MSHELVLIAGPPDADATDRRRALVAHAASEVPGGDWWTVHETPTATLAIVTTLPTGGSVASVQTLPEGTSAAIALSPRTLDVLRNRVGPREDVGAEAAHVLVHLGADGSIFVSTDAVGFLPLYWSQIGADLYLSTHLASLVSLGVPPVPDQQGSLEYLVMLHPLRERTTLRDVDMLPAGGRLDWQPGAQVQLSTRRIFVPSADALSDDGAIREFRHVWAQVIADIEARAAGERAILGLSGGLDSRAIAVESVRQGFRPLTYTYGTRHTYEGAVASSVAEALELEHLFLPVTPERMLPDPEPSCAMLDGAHSPGEMYELWFADRLRSVADVVVNGLAGGPLWGDDKALGIGTTDGVLAAQVARYRPEVAIIRRFLEPDLAAGAENLIRTSLASSLQEWDMTARLDMPIFWKIHNRQFRWGNMLTNALRRRGLRTEAPFLDSRFLTFAARLTPEQRRNGRLYLRVQREVFEQTARIPRSDDGNAPQHLDHVYWSGEAPYSRQLYTLTRRHPVSGLRRGGRQARRMGESWMRDHTGLAWIGDGEESRRSVFPSELWLRTQRQYRGRLADFLESAPVAAGLSADALERTIEDLRSGTGVTDALALAKVATLQAWLADYRRRDQLRRSQVA